MGLEPKKTFLEGSGRYKPGRKCCAFCLVSQSRVEAGGSQGLLLKDGLSKPYWKRPKSSTTQRSLPVPKPLLPMRWNSLLHDALRLERYDLKIDLGKISMNIPSISNGTSPTSAISVAGHCYQDDFSKAKDLAWPDLKKISDNILTR